MKKYIALFCLVLLAGCTTTTQSTVQPTEAVFSATRVKVKNALIATLSDNGYSIQKESESQIVFEKATNNTAAIIFYGTSMSPKPYVRISALFLNNAPTTVRFKASIISNPNTGFEKAIDSSNSNDFKQQISKYIEATKSLLK